MKTVDIVRKQITKFPHGKVFTYSDFQIDASKVNAMKVALFGLVKDGSIERLSKGKFYIAEQGIFGTLKPDESEIVKDLLFDGKRPVGYITGYVVFNRLLLTTQVPNVIQVGVNFDKKQIKRGKYTIRFIRQWNKITRTNIPLLQLLDCIRFIKTIPDSNINQSFQRIKNLLGDLSEKELVLLTNLALKYPTSTRSLTGALLDNLNQPVYAELLFKSLNPATSIKVNISDEFIKDKAKWKLK